MSDDRLLAKQHKLELEGEKVNAEDGTSHENEVISCENRQDKDAIPEWKQFYKVVREITLDMRY